MDFMPGTTIDRAARMLLAEANHTKKWATGAFNGTMFLAWPGNDVDDVIKFYFEVRRSQQAGTASKRRA